MKQGFEMKIFFTELYFYKLGSEKNGYKREPSLDDYQPSPMPFNISASDWIIAEKEILEQYPSVAYIHVLDSRVLEV